MAPFLSFVMFIAAQSLLHNVAYAQDIPDTSALLSSVLGQAGEAIPTPTTIAISTTAAGDCPAVWATVASDLKADMKGCNDIARSAIRFAFHDAAGYSSKTTPYGPASGGADGSLLLNDEEIGRGTENPMQGFRTYLKTKYSTYSGKNVSAADFIQFAGSIGTRSCPGGPVYKTVVGREDDSSASPDGVLPAGFGKGSDYKTLIALWEDKGISPRELAALMGAHSVSKARAQQANGIPAGSPQDDTPTKWDVNYYKQTQAATAPRGVYRFDSDVALANATTASGQAFTEFGNSLDAWNAAFSAAMYKLSLLGIPGSVSSGFIDCTSLVQ